MFDFISSKGIDPETEFDLIELIGQGNYGRVYKVIHKKTGKIYSAKIAYIQDVYDLIKQIPSDKKIWLYTGYTWENMDFIRRLVANSVDVLVDGQFVDELKDMTLPFRGSSNQRLIDIKKTLDSFMIGDDKIVEYKIN